MARGLRAFAPTADDMLASARSLLRVRRLARGELFLKAGEHASELSLVVQGWLREFYLLPDGSERTKAFAFEGNGSGSYPDLMSGHASSCCIVAEADARIVCLRYDAYRTLCAQQREWALLHVAVMESLFLRKARREYELLALDAAGRYRALLAEAPGIEQRVSGKHLASYLGITAVHLSRLRRQRARAPRDAK
ncbi:MAG TPA: Crp/Fnr family transcriptional regulator [Polyangiales bacterium]|nr:Crp/Fnr family transcriptional regulator [Polyangiales bacterium]